MEEEFLENNDDFVHVNVCNSKNLSYELSMACPCEEDDLEIYHTKITVLSIITILTVIGNVCVILAIFFRHFKMSRMYYFILHLSLADLLTALLTLFPEIVWTFFLPCFYAGNVACKVMKFLQMVGPYLSSYVLIMTAIDRYQAICNPLSNCTWTPRRSNIMIGTAWIIAFLLCIPQVVLFSTNDNGDRCVSSISDEWGLKAYVTWFAISNFFVPLIFLVFCYGRICHAIWANFNYSKANPEKSGFLGKLKNLAGKARIQSFLRKKNVAAKMEIGDENTTRSAMIVIEQASPENNGSVNPDSITILKSKEHIRLQPNQDSCSDLSSRSASPTEDQEEALESRPKNAKSKRMKVKQTRSANPRRHSVQGISRAKIKTVKLTTVVISGYIACSAPFICVQLWQVWGKPPLSVVLSMEVLFWMLTLNSVVNPWIYMLFNANLFQSLGRTCCPHLSTTSTHQGHVTTHSNATNFKSKRVSRDVTSARPRMKEMTRISTLDQSRASPDLDSLRSSCNSLDNRSNFSEKKKNVRESAV